MHSLGFSSSVVRSLGLLAKKLLLGSSWVKGSCRIHSSGFSSFPQLPLDSLLGLSSSVKTFCCMCSLGFSLWAKKRFSLDSLRRVFVLWVVGVGGVGGVVAVAG